ncbi:Uncharacterised protein [Staphylococcus intermedius NCTC 11048]|uniref:Uncharacterized protein n=1 Tax=Staphylococcus intermedius NCTC 11048 TaxID=1141106 RepID=A0A380GAK5_STAIN|nr:Uncharacterised protein [Staphylococcus intermedius NCTC 11048]
MSHVHVEAAKNIKIVTANSVAIADYLKGAIHDGIVRT